MSSESPWAYGYHRMRGRCGGGAAAPNLRSLPKAQDTALELQHAIGWVEEMRRIAQEVAEPYGPRADKAQIARDVWNWDWLPVCSDGTGGMLVIDASMDTRSNPLSPVGYRAKDDGSVARPITDSIGSLVREWIKVIDTEAVHLDASSGQPTVDVDLLPSGFDRAILGAP